MNEFTIQTRGKIYKVSNYSVNRMLRVLRYRGIDMIAFPGYRGFSLITEYAILFKDGYAWHISISM